MPIPTEEYLSSLRPYILEYLQSPARHNALMWHRGARKTAALVNKLLIEAFQIVGLYWYIGPYLIQARDTVWKDPNTNIFRWIPEDYQKVIKKNESELSLTLPNGSIIKLKGADHKEGLRGPKPKGVCVDEYGVIAHRFGAEVREAIIEPSIRSSGGWADYAGTPEGNNDFAYILTLARKDPANWWGSVKTVEDTGIYTPQEIADIKSGSINEDFFYQEYYCRITEGAATVFKKINEAVKGTLERPIRGEEYLFGIDLARTLDNTVLVGFKKRNNHLVYYEKLSNNTWETQKFKIKQALWAYNNAEAVIDATGVGDSFVESLMVNDQLSLLPLKISNNIIKRNLIEKLAAYIENKHISYPSIPDILDELANFEYKLSAQSRIQYSAPSGKHDDCVMAMAMAVSMLQPIVQTGITYDLNPVSINPRTGYIE